MKKIGDRVKVVIPKKYINKKYGFNDFFGLINGREYVLKQKNGHEWVVYDDIHGQHVHVLSNWCKNPYEFKEVKLPDKLFKI